MGMQIELSGADGFHAGAYRAEPDGPPRGGVVVIQEIFGVNAHIREVADGFASAGYLAVAPALFDRLERGVELGYDAAGMEVGIDLARGKLNITDAMTDLAAAIDVASEAGKVGVVGYCYGGLLTWLAACRLDGVAAASSYYGGGVPGHAKLRPKCPVILHFGALDAHIPLEDVETFAAAHPESAVHVYDADHGFNCDHRASFDAAASELARERTLAHFRSLIG